jgi:hypothetical protein
MTSPTNNSTLVVVTTDDNREYRHRVLRGGIQLHDNGSLTLTYDDDNGELAKGHVYAPGRWREFSISDED